MRTGGFLREDARSLAASTFVVTASLTLAGIRVKALATSSNRRLALVSRPLRFLADRTVSATSLDRRVTQEETSVTAELTAQGAARPAVRTPMATLEASLPMTSEMASRTMSCTMRTIIEATVSPPEIAPATSPVMRRCRVWPFC